MFDLPNQVPLFLQAFWLASVLRHPDSTQIGRIVLNAIPKGSPLEVPVATLCLLEVAPVKPSEAVEGESDAQQPATEMLAIATGNRAMSEQDLQAWLAEFRRDPESKVKAALREIENSVQGEWLIDRKAVLEVFPHMRS